MKADEVKKAVVLAAGFGTRLRPLTLEMPKPLLPIWGVPMLERTLRMLEKWGVEHIAVNACWKAEQVREYCLKRNAEGGHPAEITVSEEQEILGTGGALNPLKKFIGNDAFWLVNGDVVAEDLQPQPIVDAFERSGNFAGCWMSENFGPRTIEADIEGRVCNWKSDVAGDNGTYTYCGCALLSPEMMKYLPPNGFSTIISAFDKAMMTDARFVVGVDPDDAFWADCGTPESYLEAHAALDQARFEENPNVIFEGTAFLDSADLNGCVVTGGLIGGEFERTVLVRSDRIGNAAISAVVNKLGWKGEDTAVQFLGARGSDRSFWRLVHGDDRAIAIEYDDGARPENARYASHAKLLQEAGVSVPDVLADLPEKKILALADWGAGSLEDRANAHRADLKSLYSPVIKALAALHTKGTELALAKDVALEPAFGPDLYQWERNLFEEFCVKGRYGIDAGLPADVKAELETVAKLLCEAMPVVVHRDFQCSNVLYCDKGADFAIIDFQGMRLGAAAYDLASLLYDPYAPLNERHRKALAKEYASAAPSLPDAVKLLPVAAVQRLVQALGAFGRLASVGQPRFSRYVLPALSNLLEAADEANFDAIGGFAEELIAKEEIRLGHFHHHHHEDE